MKKRIVFRRKKKKEWDRVYGGVPVVISGEVPFTYNLKEQTGNDVVGKLYECTYQIGGGNNTYAEARKYSARVLAV